MRLAATLLVALAAAEPARAQAPMPDSLATVRSMIKQARFVDAETAARRLLERERSLGASADSMRIAETLDVLVEALWRGGKAGRPETPALAYEALGIQQRRRGADDVSVAATLFQLANVLRRTADYDGARAALDRALVIRERTLGPMHPDVAQVLNSLGNLRRERGDAAGAETAFRRALAIREQALGPTSLDVAVTLLNLGATLEDEGRFADARAVLERALAIQQQALGPDHLDLASTLENLGNVSAATGDGTHAQELYERVLAIREAHLGPDHPDVAMAADNLGLTLLSGYHLDAARAQFERARAIREAAFGPEHPLVAASLDHMAGALTEAGDYADARPMYEHALAIRERALGADHPLVAESLSHLGRLLKVLRDLPAARRDLERALAIDERRLGPRHPTVAANLALLANIVRDEGSTAEALRLMRRAVALSDTLAAGPDQGPPSIITDFAGLLAETGRPREADSLLRRSLERAERVFGTDDVRTALLLDRLGRTDADRGRWADSRRHLERALATMRRVYGADHADVLYVADELTRTLAAAGDTTEALRLALDTEERSRTDVRRAFLMLPERQALNIATEQVSGYDVSLALVSRGTTPAARRQVLDGLIRTRALALDATTARHSMLAHSTDSTTAAALARYRRAGERLAAVTVKLGTSSAAVAGELERARAEAETAERALAESAPALRSAVERDRVGIDAVAAALPESTALVSYARFIRSAPRAPGRGTAAAGLSYAPEYLAFVLRAGEVTPAVVPLGPADHMDRLVAAWRREASSGPLERSPERLEPDYRAAGTALRRAAWDPVAAQLGRADRVLVVPDGALALVNFATLPVGTRRYLIQDGPRIHYLSAERDVAELEAPGRGGGGLLTLGDPAYDASSGATAATSGAPALAADGHATERGAGERGAMVDCPDFASVRFHSLPGTRREVDEVAALWREGRSHSGVGSAGILELTGAQADEASFRRAAPGRAVLHIATHGFCLATSCAAPAVGMRGIGSIGFDAGPAPPQPPAALANRVETRGVLAGLALAGANRRASAASGDDDGILTAEEVGALDLSGVGWAVLSACETGVGDVIPGEGVVGLRRSFQIAGVRTLIMSLWPVDDDATREWMQALYRARFVRGLATDAAARAAGLEVLAARARRRESTHPFFWGAFVAAGDWK